MNNRFLNKKSIDVSIIEWFLPIPNLLQPKQATVATFGNDTAILVVDDDAKTANKKLQKAVNQINSWTKKWRIKLNESKSTH